MAGETQTETAPLAGGEPLPGDAPPSGDAPLPGDAPPSGRSMDKPTVFAAALLVAVGGIIYELILGTAASYLFGDSVVAFSVATGLTLFGMGIGSLLATRLATNPGLNFVRNEVALALLGGSSVLILYAAFSLTQVYWLVFVLLSLAIGVGIGVEIPLLVALLKEHGRDESVGLLSKVLAVDYFGALAASLLFPFVMLPYLGLMRTAYAVALLNVLVAVFMLRRMGRRTRWTWFSWATVVLLVVCFGASNAIEGAINTRLYQDPVVHYESTSYQKLVLTTFGDDVRLYLSDQLQFSSVDEARYHETLAHATLTSVAAPASVAILGGGDGLLAREVLRYPSVREVTVVDLDPAVTELARTDRLVSELNEHSFDDPRVTVVNGDAFRFMDTTDQTFDAVLIDLVDPSNERIAKLYSTEFYAMVANHLRPGGVYATQATSSYFTPNAYWQVAATVRAGSPGRTVVPLSVNVPSFGEWGFVLSLPAAPGQGGSAADGTLGPDGGARLFGATPLPEGLRFHTLDSLRATATLAGDHPGPEVEMKASTLLSPLIYRTYQQDMSRWRY
ncbi:MULTISPECIES: polyamine aminopropyltransferase [unclassified Oerskovia]|uniref:polyamine aminopropyltransferase n=1 Tax=unclassified Oerskovia TaxID=2619021 RepID=UPI000ACC6582|nr:MULTISPECIES: polyamine aminopropyltransferase [unclassified Oerskovia]